MPRLRPLTNPVTLQLDGEPVEAERGEPVAAALVAAGHLALARSPKFHRPRGPACFRGACDGCLARVDDVPNVMTCRIPAAEGLRVETQNVVGSRDTDLLRMADWFFPEGMNHHELLAGVPGLNRVMQGFARRVAGLGRLPEPILLPREAARRQLDALVVGSGPGGMAAALELAGRGRTVVVVDDGLAWGGTARALLAAGRSEWGALLGDFERAVAGGDVQFSARTTAAGLYGDDLLLVREGADGAEGADPAVQIVSVRTMVLAPGAHDGAAAFEGNDLPGVMSARAACRLGLYGVTPGKRPVVARLDGGTLFGDAAATLPGAAVLEGAPTKARGSARVKRVSASEGRDLPCDALLVDAPPAPAYELCAQAGATLSHERRGYRVQTGKGGRVRDGVFATGEAVGVPLDPAAMTEAARGLAV